jgi:nucleoside-diphosphate-sugar epimerase
VLLLTRFRRRVVSEQYFERVRVFLAGASGVIGVRLTALLTAARNDVAGMTRSIDKAAAISALGATPVVCDVFDARALTAAVVEFRPDVVLHELTDLPDDVARITDFGASNARIRREGTTNLLAAASAAGVSRFLAQSVAWELPGDAGLATADLESAVLAAGGVVLRYGQFYGPGTYHEADLPDAPRIEINEAAVRTLAALDAPTGIVVITEDS